jgi:hypothetical protein
LPSFRYSHIVSCFSLPRSHCCVHDSLGVVIAPCTEPRHREELCHSYPDVGSCSCSLHLLRRLSHSMGVSGVPVAWNASDCLGISSPRRIRYDCLSVRLQPRSQTRKDGSKSASRVPLSRYHGSLWQGGLDEHGRGQRVLGHVDFAVEQTRIGAYTSKSAFTSLRSPIGVPTSHHPTLLL